MRGQCLLEGLGLGIDAEQHRHLAQGYAEVAQPLRLLGDGLRLVDLVAGLAPGQLRAGLALRPEPDAARAGVLEQAVRGVDHLRGRAVVADQLDAGGGGELREEVGQVARLGAGEGVDRLGRVAHDADLVTSTEPEVQQRGLDRADVLELIDHEPLVLATHLGGDPVVLAQQRRGAQQHVLHVHPALVALELLVAGEDMGDGGRVDAADLAPATWREQLVVVGPDVADLGPLDLAGQVTQDRLADLDAVAPGGPRDDRDLRLGQLGRLPAVHPGPEVADLAQGRGVEGAGLHAPGTHRAQAGAHLAGRARGEGHGEHLGGVVDPGGHAVGDPMRDRAGLAGAGTGEDADGATQRQGDLALLRIERAEQVVGGHGNELRPFRVGLMTSVDAREDTSERPSPELHDVHHPVVWLLPPAARPAGP